MPAGHPQPGRLPNEAGARVGILFGMLRRGNRWPLHGRVDVTSDAGSTIPLILGFFLIGLVVTAGGVAASDVFTRHRDLQSTCDGAAIAGANAVNLSSLHGSGITGESVPLADANGAVGSYLARDPGRAGITASVELSPDATTVTLTCTQRSHIAFGSLLGKGDGVDNTVHASARSPLTP